ncbi:MAG: hypothetical protein MMC23_009376 [Stictis urceolatum]|nr:hypothetical protein [Stictis urceolata]
MALVDQSHGDGSDQTAFLPDAPELRLPADLCTSQFFDDCVYQLGISTSIPTASVVASPTAAFDSILGMAATSSSHSKDLQCPQLGSSPSGPFSLHAQQPLPGLADASFASMPLLDDDIEWYPQPHEDNRQVPSSLQPAGTLSNLPFHMEETQPQLTSEAEPQLLVDDCRSEAFTSSRQTEQATFHPLQSQNPASDECISSMRPRTPERQPAEASRRLSQGSKGSWEVPALDGAESGSVPSSVEMLQAVEEVGTCPAVEELQAPRPASERLESESTGLSMEAQADQGLQENPVGPVGDTNLSESSSVDAQGSIRRAANRSLRRSKRPHNPRQ